MPTPSTNLGIGDIYSEANGSTPGSAVNFGDLARASYFEGPNGSNSVQYNAWGSYGNSLGANKIFAVTTDSTPNFGIFKNLDYFYYNPPDYDVTLYVENSFPTSPDDDCQNVDIQIYDNSYTYFYLTGNSGAVPAGGTYGPNTFQGLQSGMTPLIEELFWQLTVDMDPFQFGGGQVDYYINGTLVYNGPIGPGNNIFDWSMGSTEFTRILTGPGFTGSYHEVYLHP